MPEGPRIAQDYHPATPDTPDTRSEPRRWVRDRRANRRKARACTPSTSAHVEGGRTASRRTPRQRRRPRRACKPCSIASSRRACAAVAKAISEQPDRPTFPTRSVPCRCVTDVSVKGTTRQTSKTEGTRRTGIFRCRPSGPCQPTDAWHAAVGSENRL